MSCQIMTGDDQAVFFCSTMMVCFGPVMPDGEIAQKFLESLSDDPRSYSVDDLLGEWNNFVSKFRCKKCDEYTCRKIGCNCVESPEYIRGFKSGAKSEKDQQIKLDEESTRTKEGHKEGLYTRGFWAGVKSEKERVETFKKE